MTDKCLRRRSPDNNYKSALPSGTKLRGAGLVSSRLVSAAARAANTDSSGQRRNYVPSPVVTCVVRLIGRRQPARGPYGSLPVRGDDRPVCGMTTQSPHPAKDNRRALLLRLPLQTAIDWTRIRPSNNWRQFRPRLGGETSVGGRRALRWRCRQHGFHH